MQLRSFEDTGMINLDQVLCLFNAGIEKIDGDHIIRIPNEEIENQNLEKGEMYRIALVKQGEDFELEDRTKATTAPDYPQPPVEMGEMRYVEIESLGKQGDGIARAEKGYVIIVPGAKVGEQLKIEIIDVKPNFAMSSVVEDVLE